jgi:IS605 OrfB family transposase
MRYGQYQAARLAMQKGQTDLILRDGVLYLHLCIDLPTPPPAATNGFLGVDLGIVEIASDSEGNQYSGEAIKTHRRKVEARVRLLQRKQTHSAKKRLKRIARKRARFVRDANHVVSKKLIATALASKKALALEELSGIRDRAGTVGRSMRALLGKWSFYQLRQFIAYKAQEVGLPVVFVDPRNTSRTCSVCGHCDKANRTSQAHFLCKSCGFDANADTNAAVNIGARGAMSGTLMSSVVATG